MQRLADTELVSLRGELDELAGRGQGRQFPPELRERLAAWARARCAEGRDQTAVAAALGVSAESVRRWMRAEMRVPSFVKVEVNEAPTARSVAGLLVHGPRGLRVELPDVTALVELWRRLG